MRWLSLLVVLTGPAWADAVDVGITNSRVMIGRGVPTVKVSIYDPITSFHLVLKRNDGKVVDVKSGGRPGTTRAIKLESEIGHFTWSGSLSIEFPGGGTGEMPLQFDTDVVGPLVMKIDKERDIDLQNRKLTLRLSNPVSKVTLKVKMDTGLMAFNNDIEFHGEPAGTPLTVSWPHFDGTPMQISVVAHDISGAYTGTDFFPWAIEIPHEEVVFDTGRFEVRKDQQAKIDASAKQIAEAVERFGRFADVKLFIAGHTDTVGATETNRALSLGRASALVRAFRAKGLKIPMFFEGFGEEALEVETPDETDEPRNRRAQYFVAVNAPAVLNARFPPRWQQLAR